MPHPKPIEKQFYELIWDAYMALLVETLEHPTSIKYEQCMKIAVDAVIAYYNYIEDNHIEPPAG